MFTFTFQIDDVALQLAAQNGGVGLSFVNLHIVLLFQIDDLALQLASQNGDGEYLDLEASINEQAEEIQGLKKP